MCGGVFLDAIDDGEGLRPGKDKAQVFQEYPTPKLPSMLYPQPCRACMNPEKTANGRQWGIA